MTNIQSLVDQEAQREQEIVEAYRTHQEPIQNLIDRYDLVSPSALYRILHKHGVQPNRANPQREETQAESSALPIPRNTQAAKIASGRDWLHPIAAEETADPPASVRDRRRMRWSDLSDEERAAIVHAWRDEGKEIADIAREFNSIPTAIFGTLAHEIPEEWQYAKVVALLDRRPSLPLAEIGKAVALTADEVQRALERGEAEARLRIDRSGRATIISRVAEEAPATEDQPTETTVSTEDEFTAASFVGETTDVVESEPEQASGEPATESQPSAGDRLAGRVMEALFDAVLPEGEAQMSETQPTSEIPHTNLPPGWNSYTVTYNRVVITTVRERIYSPNFPAAIEAAKRLEGVDELIGIVQDGLELSGG